MRRLLVVLLALSMLATWVGTASAATEKRTVPGELKFEYGASPDDPGNCSAIVFIQWADVPGTVDATAFYTWRGKEKSIFGKPPFNDHYEWVRTYQVAAGSHWIQVGKGWSDGPTPNDCRETSEKQKKDYSFEPGATRVELTVETPDGPTPECVEARNAAKAAAAAVKKAQARVNRAKKRKARANAKRRLAKAQARKARADARVADVC